MVLETSKLPERPIIPMGRYVGRLEKIEAVENIFKKTDMDDTHQWKWTFTLKLENGELFEMAGYTGRSVGFTKDNMPHKARAWFQALNGGPLDWPAKPDNVDPEPFISKFAWVRVNDMKRDGITPGNTIMGLEVYTSSKKSTKPAHGVATSVDELDFNNIPDAEDF